MASITPRKNKNGEIISYQIKVSRGRDPVTGKQLTPYTMTFSIPEGWSRKSIERELHKTAGEFEAACARGEVLTKSQEKEKAVREIQEDITFDGYTDIFRREKAVAFSEGTWENYNFILKKASAVFGACSMKKITTAAIRAYIADLQSSGKNEKNGEPLAHKTVLKYYIILHAFFESAVEDEIITQSPMLRIKRPKPRKDELPKTAIVYNENEVRYIFECLEKEPLCWQALIHFMLDSGCRRGETVGIKWEDIDLETGRCLICRNAQYTAGKGSYISSTKSGKNRVIYLNAHVLSKLTEWKKRQEEVSMPLNGKTPEYCFTHEDGSPLNPQAPTGYLIRFGKKYNLPGIHPHALRHTMATISIANGADVVSISKKLGHSTPAVTLNVYSHANEEAQRRANEVLANALMKNRQNQNQ